MSLPAKSEVVINWSFKNTFCDPLAHNREGNGNPLQYSCLENPMDGGA